MTRSGGSPTSPREDGKVHSIIEWGKRRYEQTRTGAETWIARHRETNPLVDVAVRLYERDQEHDGSVLASAVALRVFLFLIPLVLLIVASLGFLSSHLSAEDASKQVGVTGGFAQQINNALRQSKSARWIAAGTGLIGVIAAGRSLAKVLAAANRRAWRLPIADAKSSKTRLAGAVAGMISAAGLLAILANRVRARAGVVGGSMTIVGAGFLYAAAWLVVCLTLPRGRADRTALLPGAVFVGVTTSALQWFMQFEAPGKISHASKLYGSIGIVIVSLGWFFLIGRFFVMSFAINAVVWERFGSLTTWLMQWGRLKRTVDNHPRMQRFLDAGDAEAEARDGSVALDADAEPGSASRPRVITTRRGSSPSAPRTRPRSTHPTP